METSSFENTEELSQSPADSQVGVYEFEFENEASMHEDDINLEEEEFFYHTVHTAFTETNDVQVKKDLIGRLHLFKRVSNEMLRVGCDATNYRIAKDFIKTLGIAEDMVNKLWEYHQKNKASK